MNNIRLICCGLDVHKNVIVATIASAGVDGVTSHEQRSFTTLNPDWSDCAVGLIGQEG